MKLYRDDRYEKVLVSLAESDETNTGQIQIALTGKWEHEYYGTIEITKNHLREFVKNFDEGKRDVVVDYQHSSHSPDPDQAKAAGWVKELTLKNRGKELWGTVEWTEKAAVHIRAGEYKHISPEFVLEYKEKENGNDVGATLLAVALTNRPFLEGMAPVVLMENGTLLKFNEEIITSNEGGVQVNIQIIREVLGLSEDAEEQIAEAVEKMHTENQALTQSNSELTEKNSELTETIKTTETNTDPEDGKVKMNESDFIVLKEQAKQGAEASKMLKEMKADEAVKLVLSERKIAPKQKEWARAYALQNPDGFKTFSENATAIISFDEVGSGESGESKASDVKLFIKERMDGGASLKDAQQLALTELGEEAFAEYRLAK